MTLDPNTATPHRLRAAVVGTVDGVPAGRAAALGRQLRAVPGPAAAFRALAGPVPVPGGPA